MSIALKYCLLQAFLIPTEDMVDPDSQTHEVKPKSIPAPPDPPKDRIQSQGGKINPPPEGPVQISDKVLEKFVIRMNGGENGLPAKIRKAFILNSSQDRILKMFEKDEAKPEKTFDEIINEPYHSPKIF
jgi:hypothetical protein